MNLVKVEGFAWSQNQAVQVNTMHSVSLALATLSNMHYHMQILRQRGDYQSCLESWAMTHGMLSIALKYVETYSSLWVVEVFHVAHCQMIYDGFPLK